MFLNCRSSDAAIEDDSNANKDAMGLDPNGNGKLFPENAINFAFTMSLNFWTWVVGKTWAKRGGKRTPPAEHGADLHTALGPV